MVFNRSLREMLSQGWPAMSSVELCLKLSLLNLLYHSCLSLNCFVVVVVVIVYRSSQSTSQTRGWVFADELCPLTCHYFTKLSSSLPSCAVF